MTGLPGVSFGGVSRGDSWTASGRSEYQMGLQFTEGRPEEKQRGGECVHHLKQWLILPQNVDPAFWTREAIWRTAGRAEKRRDAREARFFDITWPRDLSTEHMDSFVRELFRPFVDLGLPVQIDWETSPADDGEPNDHLHGLIATRKLSNEGFSATKCRNLDKMFLVGQRKCVADRFNAIAEKCGLEVRYDPRPNIERPDALPPEDRLPRKFVRDRTGPAAPAKLARRDEQRRTRLEHETIIEKLELLDRQRTELRRQIEDNLMLMTRLVPREGIDKETPPLQLDNAEKALKEAGIAADQVGTLERIGTFLAVGETVVVDVGDRFLIDGPVQSELAVAMRLLAQQKGWHDFRLEDWSGMPLPFSKEAPTPARATANKRDGRRSREERKGKYEVFAAARAVVHNIRSGNVDQERQIIDRVNRHGTPALNAVVARLAEKAREAERELTIDAVLDILDLVISEANIWRRYSLERDLEMMLLPGADLARPFKSQPKVSEHLDRPKPGFESRGR